MFETLEPAHPHMRNADSGGTREVILQRAEEMFAQKGYRAVSIRSITRTCGVNTAAIHYHFGSKYAVLEEIYQDRKRDTRPEIDL